MQEVRLTWDRATKSHKPAPSKFLKGPVPWDWIAEASNLPGKALHVGLALWRLSGVLKSPTVRLGNSEVQALGVNRSAKSRALLALKSAGLIRISQKIGRLPEVTLLDANARHSKPDA